MPNVKLVVVSPLYRALQTAYLMFEQHHNFNNIVFLVDPDMREQTLCSCDVPGPINQTIDAFKHLLNLDTSLLDLTSPDRDLWFLKNREENIRAEYMVELNKQKHRPY